RARRDSGKFGRRLWRRFLLHGRAIGAETGWILASPRRQHHVDHRADEDERRCARVDPDPGDVGRRVVAEQLDAEAAHAIAGDIEREQATVADVEPPVDVDQRDEYQDIPKEFVQERRMYNGHLVSGRDAIEAIYVHAPPMVLPQEYLHPPRQSRFAAVEF